MVQVENWAKTCRQLLTLAFLWLTLLASSPAQPGVVVSIDGLNPEFYLNPKYDTPALQSLAQGGAWAEKVYPVFPSFTYPNHTSLVTGCYPATHGIHGNLIGDGPAWYFEESHIRVPTLWQEAKKKGCSVGLLSWPVSVGAEADFNIPEIFHVAGVYELSTAELLSQHSTPGLLERFDVKVPETFREWDEETRRVAVGLLQEDAVDLMLIHLIQVDKAQHDYGPDAPEVENAIALADHIVADIQGAAGKDATLVIVGDHGFRPYRHIFRPKAVLREAGLEHLARVEATGGSAAVYTDSPEVRALFSTDDPAIDRILSQEELARMEAFPGAKFCLLAAPDYIFSRQADGPSHTERVKGQHGHLPEQVPTGLIIHGPGVAPKTKLGSIDLIHVAPTIAHLLGISLPQAQGQSLLEDAIR